MQTFNCARCDVEFTRPPARGQRPKWCADCRVITAHERARESWHRSDNAARQKAEAAERTSARQVEREAAKVIKLPRDARSPLSAALADGDRGAVIVALLVRTATDGDCRIWQGNVDKNGYGKVRVDGRTRGVHRVMGEAVHGNLHGEPVHHACARTACIEPTHLQPVSTRENAAEMLERTWYVTRIAHLEAALAQHSPGHALLAA